MKKKGEKRGLRYEIETEGESRNKSSRILNGIARQEITETEAA